MIKAEAFKTELDERMGRLKTEASVASSSAPSLNSNVFMSMMATPNLQSGNAWGTLNGNAMMNPLMQTNSVIASPKAGISNTTTTSKRQLSEKQKLALERNRKRFANNSGVVSSIVKVGVPYGTLAYYQFKTYPSLFIPGEAYHPIKAMLSAGKKLALWLLQFASIAKYSMEDVKNGSWDISAKFEDRWV